jgi:chemotaxis methyl-accepting protein methylase
MSYLMCAAGEGGFSGTPGASPSGCRRPGAAPEFFDAEYRFQQLAARARTLSRHRGSVRVWCCACGTGEEAYSAAMALREAGCQGEVLATDADGESLAVARRGMYPFAAVARLGEERLRKHFFVRGADDASRVALVRGEVRAMVRFACVDPRAGARPPEDEFDFVLFGATLPEDDRAARRHILDRLAAALRPGGVLFLGQGDSAGLSHPELVPCGRSAFERQALPQTDA